VEYPTGLAEEQLHTLARLTTLGLGREYYLAGGSAVALGGVNRQAAETAKILLW
jgi:hypothetical protein